MKPAKFMYVGCDKRGDPDVEVVLGDGTRVRIRIVPTKRGTVDVRFRPVDVLLGRCPFEVLEGETKGMDTSVELAPRRKMRKDAP